MEKIWTGIHWETGYVIRVTVKNGIIADIERGSQEKTNKWIAPGLIDVQVNGLGGYDLNSEDSTIETVQGVVKSLNRGGVTRFCPTVVTGTRERMLHCISNITAACETDPRVDHAILGIHVEGPFISPADGPRGAHQREWVRDPDWDEFVQWQEAAKGRIKKVAGPRKTRSNPFY